jgi:hypothetical protein
MHWYGDPISWLIGGTCPMSLCENWPRAMEANHRPVKRGGKNAIKPSFNAVVLSTSMVTVATIPMRTLRSLKIDIDFP